MRRNKKNKKKKRGRGKVLSLVLLALGTGAYFYYEIPEWIGGINRFILRRAAVTLGGPADLPLGRHGCGVRYAVKGTPDYTHVVRQPTDRGVDSCFRMVGFQNRLIVCARHLETPASIDHLLTPQTFTGPLVLLEKTRLEEALRRGFKRFHNVEFPPSAYILFDGQDPGPSREHFLVLTLTGIVCIISCCEIIKSARRHKKRGS